MSAEFLYELRRLRLEEVLEELEIPVLTVQASEDLGVDPEVSRRYGAPNSLSRYIEIDDSEHGFVAKGEDGLGEETRGNWEKFEQSLFEWLDN